MAAIDFILRNGLQVYGNVGIGTTSNAGISAGNVAAIFGKTYHAGNIQLGNTNTISGIQFADGTFQSTALTSATLSNVAAFSASNLVVTATSTDSTFYVAFFEGTTANIGARVNNSFTYNPAKNTISLGNIVSSKWEGQVIAASYGGTGMSSYVQGDILYASSATTIGVISSVGTGVGPGNVLVNGVSGPSWGSLDLSSSSAVKNTLGVTYGGTGTSTQFTLGSVVFAGASGVYTQDNAKFFWDNTNKRLGLGTAAPSQALDVNGSFLLRSNAQVLGNLVVNNSTRFGNLSITNTTAATSTTSGALIVAGGMGLAGNAFVGGNIGIGTSATQGYRLYTLGNSKVTGSVDVDISFLGQPNDTAATPSYSWTGDQSTGMFRPSAGNIGFSTNGIERVRISTDGFVGIGTGLPASKLQVAGNTIVSNVMLYSGFSYGGGNLDVSALEFNLNAIAVSNDGTMLYALGFQFDRILAYSMSTPWEISTATYIGQSAAVTTQNQQPSGLTFEPDGRRAWITGQAATNGNVGVYEYDLATPWVVTSGFTYTGNILVTTAVAPSPNAIAWRPDGKRLFVLNRDTTGTAPRSVIEYEAAIPWTIGSMSNVAVRTFSVSNQEINPLGLSFTNDGTRMFVVGSIGDDINIYDLSVPWDISTASFRTQYSLPALVSNITSATDMFISPDGSRMYVANDVGAGTGNVMVYQFEMPTSTMDVVGTTRLAGSTHVYQDLSVYGKFLAGSSSSLIGNVGIGTTVPSQSLDVNGSTLMRSNLWVIGNVLATGSGWVGNLSITNTTAATSTSTGALIVAGGVGVAGNLFTTASAWHGNLSITNTTAATSTSTGALIVAGGVGVLSNVVVGNSIFAGNMSVTNATASTSTTTGAILVPLGGVGVSGNITVGNAGRFGNIGVTNTTVSTSTTTGALLVAGGTGIGGNLYVNNTAVFGNTTQGSFPLFWTVNTTNYPPTGFTGSLGINFSGGQGEVDFWNNYTAAAQSFRFYQQLSASTSSVVLQITAGGTGTFLGGLTATNTNVTGSTAPANGTFLPTTNTLGFATNTTERLRIDSSGNVSIGTSTVLYPSGGRLSLTLNGTSGTVIGLGVGGVQKGFWYTDGTNVIFVSETGSFGISNGTANPLTFGTNATERMRIDAVGNVGIGTATISSGNVVSIYGGNVFVAGNLLLGNTAAALGGIQFSDGTFQATAATPMSIATQTASTAYYPVFVAGTGTQSEYINATSLQVIPNSGNIISIGSGYFGNIGITNTTTSTSATTGALLVAGGAGIVGNLFTAASAWHGNLAITNTTTTTTTTAGALTIAGGVGVVGNVAVGNSIFAGNISVTNATASTSTTTGAILVPLGGVGIAGNITVGNAGRFGNVYVSNATATTTTTAGALTIAGGVGVVGNVAVGNSIFAGNIGVTNATAATSTATGAVIVAGGVGVAGNVYAGNLYATTFYGAANTAINASNVVITATATNATFYPAFIEASSGNLGVRVDTALTYNPSTDALTAGQFIPSSSTAPATGLYLPATGTPAIATTSTERLRVDVNGNVGINQTSPTWRLDINSNALAATANAQILHARFQNSSSNADRLEITSTRNQSGGASWTTAGHRLQQKVDSTWMAYIHFNGTSSNVGVGTTNNQGITFGAGGSTVGPNGVPEAMRITNNGDVGIGTNSPISTSNYRTLSLAGTTGGALSLISGSTQMMDLSSTSAQVIMQTKAAVPLLFGINSSEKMRIDTNGNVGISNSSPVATLTVSTTQGQWSTNNYGKQMLVTTSGTANNPAIGISDNTGGNLIALVNNLGGVFTIAGMPALNNSATAPSIRFQVDQYGNTSINTSTVGYPIANRTSVTINGTSQSLLSFYAGGAQKGYIYTDGTNIATSADAGAYYINASTTTIFQTASTEKMRLDVNGNLAIGTSSTAGGPLYIYRATNLAQAPYLSFDGGATAQYKITRYLTNTVARWDLGVNNTSESGSNAGSDFYLNAFSDAGAYLFTPFSVARSTGRSTFHTELAVANALGTGGQIRMVSGNYGAFWRNDGTNFYLFFTTSGNQYGTWSDRRPFYADIASGQVYMANGATITNNITSVGDITAYRAASIGTGAIYLGNSGTRYLYYDGTNYNLNGAGLAVGGEITAYSSDQRLKGNINAITDAVDKVRSLNGVTFDWKAGTEELGFLPSQKRDVGVLAQDVERVLPEAVRIAPFDRNDDGSSKSGENYLTVQYEKLTALLIEAVKDQQTAIEAQSKRITAIEAMLGLSRS